LNEILQSWCYAQELETIEHAFMNVVTTLCGQVRPFIADVKSGGILIRCPQDVNVDLEDDVSKSARFCKRKLTDKAAHCALGSALSAI
jgi:hypothetical protein